ncbi:Poly ADP-ribose polymerase [Hondaea fermentalgiana]|uniref:Poly ADP-ribose polymerase n=1 Tax=Hondaea fermentalgiana TaxID=2315210 RepID=A0A2R5FZ95_9STRA|nr:Poly ADP-ribose polymerase [Hondaea fermentalgiana]|eukprot:GBG24076.1 Poly ADP-ribose polymerase [Hondaea fermentalgiana]
MAPPALTDEITNASSRPPSHLDKQEKAEVLEAGPGGRTKTKKFGLEESPSGRATCRSCNKKIANEALRWTFSENNTGPFYFHLECMPYPVDGVPFDDIVRQPSLRNEQVQEAKAALEEAREKRERAKLEELENEVQKLAHMDLTPRNETSRDASEKDLREEYASMPVDELKEYLRVNNYPRSGNKEELVNRCALGQVLGQLPRCPKCRWGKLSVDTTLSTYLDPLVSCLGHFNTVYHEQCDFTKRGEEARSLFESKWQFLPDVAAELGPDAGKAANFAQTGPREFVVDGHKYAYAHGHIPSDIRASNIEKEDRTDDTDETPSKARKTEESSDAPSSAAASSANDQE